MSSYIQLDASPGFSHRLYNFSDKNLNNILFRRNISRAAIGAGAGLLGASILIVYFTGTIQKLKMQFLVVLRVYQQGWALII